MKEHYLSWFLFIVVVLGFGLILTWYNKEMRESYSAMFESKMQASVLSQAVRDPDEWGNIKQDVEILFVGDVMFGRGVEKKVQEIGRGDWTWLWLGVVDEFKKADLVVANLEGPISQRGVNQGSKYSFRFTPSVIGGLKFAGVKVVSVANNHIWDWGSLALNDTLYLLKINGISPVGAGLDYEEANEPVIRNIGGNKIAFLAYTDLYPESLWATTDTMGISDSSLETAVEKVAELEMRNDIDLVVVMWHFGNEYETRSNASQQEKARSLIEAGADLIVGHHPHVVQEMDKYKDRWIAYSLGNFIFDQNFSEETMRGQALKVFVRNGEVAEVKLKSILISEDFQPRIAEE